MIKLILYIVLGFSLGVYLAYLGFPITTKEYWILASMIVGLIVLAP